jgi:hypothetical protein
MKFTDEGPKRRNETIAWRKEATDVTFDQNLNETWMVTWQLVYGSSMKWRARNSTTTMSLDSSARPPTPTCIWRLELLLQHGPKATRSDIWSGTKDSLIRRACTSCGWRSHGRSDFRERGYVRLFVHHKPIEYKLDISDLHWIILYCNRLRPHSVLPVPTQIDGDLIPHKLGGDLIQVIPPQIWYNRTDPNIFVWRSSFITFIQESIIQADVGERGKQERMP